MDKLTAFCFFLIIFVSSTFGQESELRQLLQVGGQVDIRPIADSRVPKNLPTAEASFEDTVEHFLKGNELTIAAPFASSVTLTGRNLDNGELDFKLRLDETGSEVQARRKKSKIKKVLAPILVVLVLKAITLIPLALGLLGIKTWNALQLSFVSFVTSIVLAVWKLCAKFSDHHHVPHVIHEAVHDVHVPHVVHDSHHEPWDHHYHRSDDTTAQQTAYSTYVPENRI